MSRSVRHLSPLFVPLIAVALWLVSSRPSTSEPAGREGTDFLFCFWNAENLFDDRREEHPHAADREYDSWFATDGEARQLKYDHLASALVRLNHGKGPDILALAEVESERAAELLAKALNAHLRDRTPGYTNVLYRDPHGGRNIANAILTRLPVIADRTQLHGRRQRVLEGHVRVRGHDLVVLATHWTSRVSDTEGDSRDHYADLAYGVFKGMYKANPKVDFLVCGDFNDPPDDDSVRQHLHAVGMEAFKAGGPEPLLLNLFADKVGGTVGTHFYRGKWLCFDQICVSPGMLDHEGWWCDPASAHIVNDLTADNRGRPHRFGNERDKAVRGWSDHFPVTVRLHVGP